MRIIKGHFRPVAPLTSSSLCTIRQGRRWRSGSNPPLSRPSPAPSPPQAAAVGRGPADSTCESSCRAVAWVDFRDCDQPGGIQTWPAKLEGTR